jgi:Fe-S cluster assembly protein SufD
MNVTSLDQALLESVVEGMPDDKLAGARRRAAAQFASMGFPTVGQEDWKYTNLTDVVTLSNAWLESAANETPKTGEAADEIETTIMTGIEASWIVIRDGLVESGLPAPDGVSIERVSSSGNADINGDDPLSLLNTALLRDGIRIVVDESAVPAQPVGILFVDDPANALAQTRVIVEAGANARLQLIEYSLSSTGGRQFTNAVTEFSIAPGARVDHVRIQTRDDAHSGVNRITASIAADAQFHHNSFDLGGLLTRNDVVTKLLGRGATVSLNGLYLAAGDRHIDNHTKICHETGPTVSNEEYRGILGGRSQCVFNGKVIVAEGADGTDSSQSNHNLLLSDRAEIDTKPELEIYADDVKCAHGATVGQLDKAALFYLQSRGLDPEEARQVLTRAFAAGTLAELTIDACHDHLAALLDRSLETLVGDMQ